MRIYILEVGFLAVRSFVLSISSAGVATVLLDARSVATLACYVVTAGIWLVWWLAAGGRRHIDGLCSEPLDAMPADRQPEPPHKTAIRVAVATPAGFAVAVAALVVGDLLGIDSPVVAGVVAGSLLGLAAIRAIETAALARSQPRTGRIVYHEPGPGSRHGHAFFAQPRDVA